MLLNRDYVGHMASEVIKKLLEDEQIEIKEKDQEAVIPRVRHRMLEEITIEDKVNEEVRNILTQYQDEMRRTGVSYQEMFKKVKGQIARDRKLILRERTAAGSDSRTHAIEPRKNCAHLSPDSRITGAEQRSGVHRGPRYHPPAHGPDHDQRVERRRKNRSRSTQAHYFAKKEILEGSEEWDVLFRKYYAEELRRQGIAAAPEEHQKAGHR